MSDFKSGLALQSQVMYWKSKGFSSVEIAKKLACHVSTVEIYKNKSFEYSSKEMADWIHERRGV